VRQFNIKHIAGENEARRSKKQFARRWLAIWRTLYGTHRWTILSFGSILLIRMIWIIGVFHF